MPTEVSAVSEAAASPVREPSRGSTRRRELALWLGGGVAAAVILVITVTAMGGRLEAATWGLVVAAGAMVFALHSLYRMATVLSRPAVEAALEQDDVAAYAGVRELREERRRLLRAINELQFDYEMGKLSDEDYRTVRQGYELQAVEVIRALDAERTLHPSLREELLRRGLGLDEAPTKPGAPEVAAEAEASESAEASEPAEASEAADAREAASASDEHASESADAREAASASDEHASEADEPAQASEEKTKA